MNELEVCPVCGGSPFASWFIHHSKGKLWYVRCNDLCCTTGMYPTEKDAIDAWNRGEVIPIDRR